MLRSVIPIGNRGICMTSYNHATLSEFDQMSSKDLESGTNMKLIAPFKDMDKSCIFRLAYI